MVNQQVLRFDKQSFIEKAQLVLLIAFMFFIPISPAAPNIIGVLLMLLWLWQGQFQQSWLQLKAEPIFWAFMAYLVIYPLSLIWTDNMEWGMHMVERHVIFLLFPFIYLAAKKVHIAKYIAAFIVGMTLTEFTSYLVWFELIQIEGVSPENPTPFYRHTIYNPMLAWALYLLFHGLFFEKHSWPIKLFYALFIVTMTINMFITGGRGGQVAFFVISGLVFLQYFASKDQLYRGLGLAFAFIVGVFFIAYQASPSFHQRANLAVSEVINYTPETHTSVGSRIGYYINTVNMSFNRPFLEIMFGSGVGDFPEDYTRALKHENAVKLVPSTEHGHSHPHNQYLYELGALGLVGFLIFLSMFLALLIKARTLQDDYRHHRYAFLVFMAIIMISDSLLLAHGTALLFISFAVIFSLKERV